MTREAIQKAMILPVVLMTIAWLVGTPILAAYGLAWSGMFSDEPARVPEMGPLLLIGAVILGGGVPSAGFLILFAQRWKLAAVLYGIVTATFTLSLVALLVLPMPWDQSGSDSAGIMSSLCDAVDIDASDCPGD